jgi:cold shock CspA family protein
MSQETMGKKEKEKKKQKNKRDKEEKREERKLNNNKGKGLDAMMAYVDDDGNITSTPPDPKKKKIIDPSTIQLGAAKREPIDPADLIRTGVVTFFNEAKGYGFITDLKSQDSVFVHVNQLTETIQEKDKVTFEVEMGPKGASAIKVRKEVKQAAAAAAAPPPPVQNPL